MDTLKGLLKRSAHHPKVVGGKSDMYAKPNVEKLVANTSEDMKHCPNPPLMKIKAPATKLPFGAIPLEMR